MNEHEIFGSGIDMQIQVIVSKEVARGIKYEPKCYFTCSLGANKLDLNYYLRNMASAG